MQEFKSLMAKYVRESRRGKMLELTSHRKLALAKDWPRFVVMEVNQLVVERAGEYADLFALRGYDSIQLAAAYEAGRIFGTPVCFASFDARLNKAARLLEMQCV